MKKIIITVILIIVITFFYIREYDKPNEIKNIVEYKYENIVQNNLSAEKSKDEITDWRIILVNFDNPLPDDFSPELADIDKIRKFDSRAINFLMQMITDMKKEGCKNIWPQSTYRSVEKQQEIFDKK